MRRFISGALKKINNSYWLRSGSFTFMNKVSVVLFGFVNFYILIRILSKDDFGAWVLFLSIASLMEPIKRGFVRNPLVRYLAMHPGEVVGIQTASLTLNFITGVLQMIFLYLCAIYLSGFWDLPQLRSLFMIYIMSTALLIPINHLDMMQQARMQFKGPFVSNFVRQFGLFLFILVVAALRVPVELEYLAYAQLSSIFISGFISYRYGKVYLQLSDKIDLKWIRELRSYGFFTFGTNVSSMINKSIDSWMLGRMISPAAVAIFNPAIRIANLVEVPTETLTSILFPKLSQRIAEEGPQSAKYLYEKAVGTITAFMIPLVIFVIVFAEPIVRFIAGPGFEETVPILQITMLYGLIVPFNRLLGITLDAIGRARTNFLFVFRNAVINIISNYIYISNFGIIGAAYGTFTTYVLVLIMNQIYLHRFLNVRLNSIFRYILENYVKVFSAGVRILRGAF
jgi:lipopolysaccharide exporter